MNKKLPIGTIIAVPMKVVGEDEKHYIAVCNMSNGATRIVLVLKDSMTTNQDVSFGTCTIISTPDQEYFANAKVGDKVWAIGDDEDGYIKKIYYEEYGLRVDYNGYNSISYDLNGVICGGSKQTLFYADDPRVARIKKVMDESKLKVKLIIEGGD